MRRRQILAAKMVQTRLEDMADEYLEELYFEKYGKPPHHRMKRETILERLNA